MGAVTPLGNDVETTWTNLIAGRVRRRRRSRSSTRASYPVTFACELKDFDPKEWIDAQAGAAHGPLRADDRSPPRARPRPTPGSTSRRRPSGSAPRSRPGSAGCKAFQDCYDKLLATRARTASTRSRSPQIIPNMGAAWVSMELGTRGPLSSQCTACAASNMAIGDGADAIRLGRADVMFCGGTEARITEVGIAGFGAMRALSRRNDDPSGRAGPFDAGRDGFVMGEAGGVLVLEELEHAKARGAKIYAELLGYGVSSDARTSPSRTRRGANPARAMRMAFGDAGIEPEDVDYINAHGTSTPLGDASETRVIKLALGEEKARARRRSRRRRARPATASAPRARSRRSSRRSRSTRRRAAADDQLRDARPGRATSTTSRTRRGRPEVQVARLELVRLRRAQRLHRPARLRRLSLGAEPAQTRHNLPITLVVGRRQGAPNVVFCPWRRALGDLRLLRHARSTGTAGSGASSSGSSAWRRRRACSSATTSSSPRSRSTSLPHLPRGADARARAARRGGERSSARGRGRRARASRCPAGRRSPRCPARSRSSRAAAGGSRSSRTPTAT